MKTTLNIDDTVMRRLREAAARRRTTMSALVEAGLRRVLADEREGQSQRDASVKHDRPYPRPGTEADSTSAMATRAISTAPHLRRTTKSAPRLTWKNSPSDPAG